MADANVLTALENNCNDNGYYTTSELRDIVIFGRIRCLIERPSIIGKGVADSDGYFALVDAYALKCLGTDYFNEGDNYDVNRIYFTKGSILIYVKDDKFVGKDVRVYGKAPNKGVTIKRQGFKNKGTSGISAFVFDKPMIKDGKNVYPLACNFVEELTLNSSGVRSTSLENLMVLIAKDGEVKYNETLDTIIPYSGVEEYTEITISKPLKKMGEKETDNSGNISEVSYNDKGLIDMSKIDMKLTYHLNGKEKSQYFDVFKEDIVANVRHRACYSSDLKDELVMSFSHNSNDVDYSYEIADLFANNVLPRCNSKFRNGVKVSDILNTFIDNLSDTTLIGYQDSSRKSVDISKVLDGIDYLKATFRGEPDVLRLQGFSSNEGVNEIVGLRNPFIYALNVIGSITNIGFDVLAANFMYMYRKYSLDEYTFMYALCCLPYYLGLMSIGLTIVDCDMLYYALSDYFGDPDSENAMKMRKVLLMLDTLKSCCQGENPSIRSNSVNTFVSIRDYKGASMYYSGVSLNNVKNNGYPGNQQVTDAVKMLMGEIKNVTPKEVTFDGKWFNEELYENLISNGIVNTLFDKYCALERTIEEEFMIYETFIDMGKMETGITDDIIEETIEKFEADRGFKLEVLQRDAIKLCKYRAGVLSGCAGSGKTTTSDCMTEALKNLGDRKIIYCTPTGKACRRLAEVVHSTVKTIHSQFNVMIGGGSYLQSAYFKKEDDSDGEGCIYILDEMAMCNTELMYYIAKNITKNDIIYFLGDVKQLPPIGGGCPFKILMDLLPCVELGVSKRAAEGSLVNYNTSVINFLSNGNVQPLTFDRNTFIDRSCGNAEIVATVKKTFVDFLEGNIGGIRYGEDDIQVITGYASDLKVSSTSKLNVPIQQYLRSKDKLAFYKQSRKPDVPNKEFYQNDRIIYINRNSYDICRYIYSNGVFCQVATIGCVNGEMGKLVGVVEADKIKISKFNKDSAVAGVGFYENVSEEEMKAILEKYEEREDGLRKDETYIAKGYYFIVFKVYDTDLRQDVFCLLRGRARGNLSEGLCLSGSDLDNIDLAYALTCHKMQGSQSKVVVVVLENGASPSFINRNMINTMITRSQGIVCLIGSINGDHSTLNVGRQYVSKTESQDLLSVLSGTDRWCK